MTSFLGIVMILVFFFWAIILLLATRRLLQFWFEIREESFLHLMLIMVYPAFLFIILAAYYIILSIFTPGEDIRIPTFYIPVLFGFTLLLSIVNFIINERLYSLNLLDNTLFLISLILMLYLCVRIFSNLQINKQFFDDQEKEFIVLLEKLTILFLFICGFSGLLHIIMSIQTIYFAEVYMIIAIISLSLFGLIFLYYKKLIEERAKNIDWLVFFNNIS